jgi:hypothetical protein
VHVLQNLFGLRALIGWQRGHAFLHHLLELDHLLAHRLGVGFRPLDVALLAGDDEPGDVLFRIDDRVPFLALFERRIHAHLGSADIHGALEDLRACVLQLVHRDGHCLLGVGLLAVT